MNSESCAISTVSLSDAVAYSYRHVERVPLTLGVCLIFVFAYLMSAYLVHGDKNEMTIQAHLAALEQRHEKLDEEITEALAHSSSDDLKIAELKRRKLQLKDEIERLQRGGEGAITGAEPKK